MDEGGPPEGTARTDAQAGWHLAQVNVARAVAPMESPAMRGFVRAAAAINRDADGAPGFVWRLQDETGDAMGIRFLDDPRIVVNLSVWESVAAMESYMYDGRHRDALQRRRQWFEPLDRPATAMWWVPAGHRPDLAEAERALRRLWDEGPSSEVFGLGGGPSPPPPGPGPASR